MAQNIIYSPCERTKGPWLCLMTTLLLFSLLCLFLFISAFLIYLIKLTLWLKFSTNERQAGDMEWGWGEARSLESYFVSRCHMDKIRCAIACQAPLSMKFSRQDYWGGLPFPSSGDLPEPGIKPVSLTSPTSSVGPLLVPPGKLWLRTVRDQILLDSSGIQETSAKLCKMETRSHQNLSPTIQDVWL